MGPWHHGGWSNSDGSRLGNIHFGAKTALFYQKQIELPFFEHFLKGKGEHRLAEAHAFETGMNRWRQFDHWPPQGVRQKALHFHADGRLSFEANKSEEDGYDEYVSDPKKPVPFSESITVHMTREFMTDDQRFAARRPDVLVYQTKVLDSDVTLAGPLTADLWVATSGTDSDWVVKLIDVFPNDAKAPGGRTADRPLGGYQMLVRGEVIRGRFRNGHEKPEPFTPNEPARVVLELQDVLHTFPAGHRIMVQVQSTWFPLVDRNPQKCVPNIYLADDKDFIKATQRVYRSKQHPSQLKVGVLPPEEE
jgi:putative CocE/NonD family hydrolase